MKFLICLAIRGYQVLLSPILAWMNGGTTGCRFEPSCSRYFLEAVQTHGSLRGSWLGIRRLARCQPWGGQGIDPVPPRPADSHHPKLGLRHSFKCCK